MEGKERESIDDGEDFLIAPTLGAGEEALLQPPLTYDLDDAESAAGRGMSRGWLYATVILCCYGFFKEFKASEAFLTPYLVDPRFKNFTKDQVCG
jgi:hypothetical protein